MREMLQSLLRRDPKHEREPMSDDRKRPNNLPIVEPAAHTAVKAPAPSTRRGRNHPRNHRSGCRRTGPRRSCSRPRRTTPTCSATVARLHLQPHRQPDRRRIRPRCRCPGVARRRPPVAAQAVRVGHGRDLDGAADTVPARRTRRRAGSGLRRDVRCARPRARRGSASRRRTSTAPTSRPCVRRFAPRPPSVWAETIANPTTAVADLPASPRSAARPACRWSSTAPSRRRRCAVRCSGVPTSSCTRATKYLGGHSDVTGGVVVGDVELVAAVRAAASTSAAASRPDEAFLLHRGLATLPLRVARHCATALAVAEALADHPKVERIDYPGLAGTSAARARRQAVRRRSGGAPLRRRRHRLAARRPRRPAWHCATGCASPGWRPASVASTPWSATSPPRPTGRSTTGRSPLPDNASRGADQHRPGGPGRPRRRRPAGARHAQLGAWPPARREG